MAKKEQIINNLREYSASELAQEIRNGNVSLYELSKSGKLSPLMKKRIEAQLAIPQEDVAASDTEIVSKSEQPIEVVNVEPLSSEESLTRTEITVPSVAPQSVNSDGSNNESDGIIDNLGMFKRVFSFKGRIRRLEYGISYIFYIIWYTMLTAITEMRDPNPILLLFMLLSSIPAIWFLLAQGAKRCHDRGNSGWFQIIPFYGLVMLFGGSDEGINEYGTNPKY